MQAPKRRTEHRASSSDDRRTRLYAAVFAASGILLVGGAFALVAFGGGGGGNNVVSESGLIKTKSCTETSYPGLKPEHINNPDQKVKYNSMPPSSGPHYQQPSPWGLYDQPIQETILVHNLEHGGIVLQYGHVGSSVVQKIQSFWQGDPYGFVVAPYPKLGKRIAAAAWNEPRYRQEGSFSDVKPGKGYVLTCTAFDEAALAKFRDNHRNKAGERFPSVKDMAPNT